MRAPSIVQVKDLIGLQLGVKVVPDDALLVEDLGAQSADLLNIVAALEERFGIVVAEDEIDELRTARDLFRVVERVTDSRQGRE